MYPSHVFEFESIEAVEKIMKDFLKEYEPSLHAIEDYLTEDIHFSCNRYVSTLNLFAIGFDLDSNEVSRQCIKDVFYFKNDQCTQFLAFELRSLMGKNLKLSFIDLSNLYKKCVLYWIHRRTVESFEMKYPK